MQKALEKLFTDKKLFFVLSIMPFLAEAVYLVYVIVFKPVGIMTYLSVGYVRILTNICVVALYVSFCRRNKNVTRGMIGAVLMGNFVHAAMLFKFSESTHGKLFSIIYFILSIALFVNHFFAGQIKWFAPKIIYTNRILSVLTFIVVLTIAATYFVLPEKDIVYIILTFIYSLTGSCYALSVVWVESMSIIAISPPEPSSSDKAAEKNSVK